MSGAARQRGAHRTNGESEKSLTDQNVEQHRNAFTGIYDGPASRGSISGPPSNAQFSDTRSVGSNGPTSPRLQVATLQQPGTFPPVDPARDNPVRPTDQLRNIDLPASFFKVDHKVTQLNSLENYFC